MKKMDNIDVKIIVKSDEERMKIIKRLYTPTGYNRGLKRILHAHGITWRDLEESLNVSYATIRNWLNLPECNGHLDDILFAAGMTRDDLEEDVLNYDA